LFELFSESYRVLQDGGVIIFETPNPENLQVGAFTFYIDPTHQRPLPHVLLEFIAGDAGFGFTDIVRLHPSPELAFAYRADSTECERNLANSLYSSRDYSVVAVKTGNVSENYILN